MTNLPFGSPLPAWEPPKPEDLPDVATLPQTTEKQRDYLLSFLNEWGYTIDYPMANGPDFRPPRDVEELERAGFVTLDDAAYSVTLTLAGVAIARAEEDRREAAKYTRIRRDASRIIGPGSHPLPYYERSRTHDE
jgi:hypothetical protein